MKRYAIPAHTLNRKICHCNDECTCGVAARHTVGLAVLCKNRRNSVPHIRAFFFFMIIRRKLLFPKITPARHMSADFKNKSFAIKMYIQAKSGSLQILISGKILYTNFNTFFADLLFLKKSVSLIYCSRLIFYISQCFLHSDFNITVTLFQHYIYQTSSQVRLYTQESAVLSSADRTTDCDFIGIFNDIFNPFTVKQFV